MELFLNILWVLIALCGVMVWHTQWVKQSRFRRYDSWREWTAFICAMVLLFFVVSLTDDLHAELLWIEECSTSRRHAACLTCAHHSSYNDRDSVTHVCAILPAGPSALSFAFISSVIAVPESLPLRLNRNRKLGRAPPDAVL
jgi:hypothetical protein